MNNQNIEEAFQNLFKGGSTGTGEEELLRVASKYSMQISAKQIKLLLYLQSWADRSENVKEKLIIQNFINR